MPTTCLKHGWTFGELSSCPVCDRTEYTEINYDEFLSGKIPQAILDAALDIERYFKSQGFTKWKLGNIQSRVE